MNSKKLIILTISILLIILIIGGGIYLYLNYDSHEYTGTEFYLDDIYYNKGDYITITTEDLNDLLTNKNTFLLYTYNNFCSLPIPCAQIFEEVMDKYKIDILKIPFEDFKNTPLYDTVKIAPSLIIIKEGEIVSYLDTDKDEDKDKYQDSKVFKEWLNSYVILKKK